MFIPPFLRLNLFFNFIEHLLHGKLGEALGSLVHQCCAVSGVADTGGVRVRKISAEWMLEYNSLIPAQPAKSMTHIEENGRNRQPVPWQAS